MARSPYTPQRIPTGAPNGPHNNNATKTGSVSSVTANKVLKNTYMLLAITLVFSAFTAWLSTQFTNLPAMTSLICSGLAIVILWFVLPRTANSSMGLVFVFAFTGLLGFGLGPILQIYAGMPGGTEVIMMSLAGTGSIFAGMSAIALISKRDFSFMRGFLFAGIMVAFFTGIVTMFFDWPVMNLVVSAAFLLLSSGLILYQTSEIVRGGETNYILATTTLYVSIYNIFVSLLHILGVMDD